MKTLKILGFSLATATFLTTVTLAQPGFGGQRGPMRMFDQLNLTAEQVKEIEVIHSSAMKEQFDRRAAIGKLRVDLRQLTRAETPNQSVIEKKVGEIADLESQANAKRIDTWFRVNRLLSADQQKVWKKTLERHTAFGSRTALRHRMHRDGFAPRFKERMKGRMGGSESRRMNDCYLFSS